MSTVDHPLEAMSAARAWLGAAMNRSDTSISEQRIGVGAQTASRPPIRDANFAGGTAALTRAQIPQQSGTAILGQINAITKNVLALLRSSRAIK